MASDLILALFCEIERAERFLVLASEDAWQKGTAVEQVRGEVPNLSDMGAKVTTKKVKVRSSSGYQCRITASSWLDSQKRGKCVGRRRRNGEMVVKEKEDSEVCRCVNWSHLLSHTLSTICATRTLGLRSDGLRYWNEVQGRM